MLAKNPSKSLCLRARTPWPIRSPRRRICRVVSVDRQLDKGTKNLTNLFNCCLLIHHYKGDSEICRGCGSQYHEKESHQWVGCDQSDTHWWHYKCAGYKRKPTARTKFVCSLCSEYEIYSMNKDQVTMTLYMISIF